MSAQHSVRSLKDFLLSVKSLPIVISFMFIDSVFALNRSTLEIIPCRQSLTRAESEVNDICGHIFHHDNGGRINLRHILHLDED